MTQFTIEIPEQNRYNAERALNKLANKAKKLGFSISYTIGQSKIKKIEGMPVKTSHFYERSPEVVKVFPFYIVSPEVVKIDSWKFIATIDFVDGGTLVSSIEETGIEVNKLPFFGSSECHHCKTNRMRNRVFIFQHDNGEIKQVGSTCLKDFFGHDVSLIVSMYSIIREMKDILEELEEFGCRRGEYKVLDILSVTYDMINKNGWVSKKEENETGKDSTASQVRNFLDCNLIPNSYGLGGMQLRGEKNESAIEFAEKAIEWAKGWEAEGDYANNVRVIASCYLIPQKFIGIACSIVQAYKKEIEKKSEVISEYIGEVGKRDLFLLTLMKHKSFDSQFGTKHLYSFKDKIGNSVIWWASVSGLNLEIGKEYCLAGSVKKHGEYNGKRQTELTRCKLK